MKARSNLCSICESSEKIKPTRMPTSNSHVHCKSLVQPLCLILPPFRLKELYVHLNLQERLEWVDRNHVVDLH